MKFLTLSALLATLLAGAAPALAADATPAPKTTATPAAAATPAAPPPSAAAMNAAQRILLDTGLRKSLDGVVPDMLTGLETRVQQTRPEAKDAIVKIVFALAPEFGKTEQGVLDAIAADLASQMSEKDIVATAEFYDSPAGKSYVAASAYLLQSAEAETRKWREKLSNDMLARVREELRKQGFDF